MDVNGLRAAITLICFLAFLGIVWWAYGRSRRERFDEAANLPFADEEMQRRTLEAERDPAERTGDEATGRTGDDFRTDRRQENERHV